MYMSPADMSPAAGTIHVHVHFTMQLNFKFSHLLATDLEFGLMQRCCLGKHRGFQSFLTKLRHQRSIFGQGFRWWHYEVAQNRQIT